MKKLLLLTGILPVFLFSQVGISTANPSSTLDVKGSLEANFREITASSTVNANDHHLSFSGVANATLTLPAKSLADGSSSDFIGRKYVVKNNSSGNVLTVAAATGQTIRFGGSISASNTYALKPGASTIITATAQGWDLDLPANISSSSSDNWNLYSTSMNGLAQPTGISEGSYQLIPGSNITVTVPAGVAQSKTFISMTGWGAVYSTTVAQGSLRFELRQTGTSNNTYNSIMMNSWARPLVQGIESRFVFPVVFNVDNLSPGTYTFSLYVLRENESGNVAALNMWSIQSKGDVYIK